MARGPQMPPQNPRIRPYRDLLLPALHRRFISLPDSVVTLTIGFTYVLALLMGNHESYVWMIFSAGLRAIFLYTPAFLTIMIRLQQMNFRPVVTSDGIQTIAHFAEQSGTYVTIAGYLLSGWIFSEVYIMSAPENAGLSWVTTGQVYEKLRLNENAIYLRSHAFIIALVQTGIHLYHDYSTIILPAPKSLLQISEKKQKPKDEDIQKGTVDMVKEQFPKLLISCSARSLVFLVTGPFLYLPIRPWAWSFSLWLARNVMRWNIPEYSQYDAIPPFHYSILGKTFWQALCLFSLWEVCNMAFSIYVAQEPTRNGYPLTDDFKKPKADAAIEGAAKQTMAKDPNGSLINGLMARNGKTKAFAVWELDIIVRRCEARRKSLLTELDRKDLNTYDQVLRLCLSWVDSISKTVNRAKIPVIDANKEVQHLPKIAPGLLDDPQIESPATKKDLIDSIGSQVGKFGKSLGSASAKDQFKPAEYLKGTIGAARQRLLTKEQQKTLTIEQMSSTFRSYAVMALRWELWLPKSPISHSFQPFHFLQKTYARAVKSRIFNGSGSDPTEIIRAVDALSGLVAASSSEDVYGVVGKSVPQIWRSFVEAVTTIETLEERTKPHWTDVNFNAETKRDPQVEQLLAHLKEGIRILMLNFGDKAIELDLTASDMTNARRAIAS